MKKVVSLLLVLVLALGMGTVASAAALDLTQHWSLGSDPKGLGTTAGIGWSGSGGAPGDKLHVPLAYEWFLPDSTSFLPNGGTANLIWWTTGAPGGFATGGVTVDSTGAITDHSGYHYLTMNDVRRAKIVLRAKVAQGSQTIESYGIEAHNKAACIEVEFKDPFRNNDPDGVDYDITLYLVIDGTRVEDGGIQFTGTLMNPSIDFYADDDYGFIGDGEILCGQEYNSGADVDLGEGVWVHTKIFKGKNYWGIATRDEDHADDIVFTTYADIDSVYTLDVIGLNSTAQYVTLNEVDGSFYVYSPDSNGNLKFVGMSGDRLPYSTKYYLANRELDIDDDEPDDGDEDEDIPDYPELGPETGGDDSYPENVNDNPGTGK